MTYRDRIKAAVDRTERWKLESLCSKRAREWAHHDEPFTLNNNVEWWREFGRRLPVPAEQRALSCAPVHYIALVELLSGGMRWSPVLTIGEVLVKGKACFGVHRTSLRRELRKGPLADGCIRIHVWLTFADLTIYDLTLLPWLHRQRGEPMDLQREDAMCLIGDPDSMAPEYEYRPHLVGPEFLWRTGTLQPMTEPLFKQAQLAWAESVEAAAGM